MATMTDAQRAELTRIVAKALVAQAMSMAQAKAQAKAEADAKA